MKQQLTIVEHAGSGIAMPERMAFRIDELTKENSLPADFKFSRSMKASNDDPEFGVEDGSRTDVSKITTTDPDRDGEVLLGNNFDYKDLESARDVFFAHQYGQPPVGKMLWQQQKGDDRIAKTKYAQKPAAWNSGWLPDAIHSMQQQGHFKGKSIGFLPLHKRTPTADEVARRPDWKGRVLVDKGSVFEYSVAPVPVNARAMTLAVSKCVTEPGLIDAILAAVKSFGMDEEDEAMPSCPNCRSSEKVSKKDERGDGGDEYMCMLCMKSFGKNEEGVKRDPPIILHSDPAMAKAKPKAAPTPEEIDADAKAVRRKAALEIVVPIMQPATILDYQQARIESDINKTVEKAIRDAYDRKKGRA